MTSSDPGIVLPILKWWLLLQVFGLVGLPIALHLLGRLPDGGYAFARPLGLLLSGYLLWMGATLGIWRNGLGGTLAAMAIVLGVGAWLCWRSGDRLNAARGWWQARRTQILTIELLFGIALVGWAIYKAYNPNLETAGGEKWMEIAFVNGVLRSERFPPQDPWLSGYSISYYYFGYVLMAMITRLSGLPATVAFNLFVPTLFALTLTGAFSLAYNMVYHRQQARYKQDTTFWAAGFWRRAPLWFGLLGAILVGILGNLEGALEVLHSKGWLPASFWHWLDILDINQPPVAGGWVPTRFIWWWRASRVIHDCSLQGLATANCNPPAGNWEVIDEFPFFSFLLGDVHPHVLALPFVLLAIGLALHQLSDNGQRAQQEDLRLTSRSGPGRLGAQRAADGRGQAMSARIRLSELVADRFGGWPSLVLTALCLGALGFLNTWDILIYLLVFLVSLATARARQRAITWLGDTLIMGLALVVLGVVLYLPFYVGFQSQVRGLLPNLFNPTRPPQFLVFFGPFVVAIVGYLFVLWRETRPPDWGGRLLRALLLSLLGPILAMLLVIGVVLWSPAARTWVQELLGNPAMQSLLGDSAHPAALIGLGLRLHLLNPWTFLLLGSLLAWALALWWPGVSSAGHRNIPIAGSDNPTRSSAASESTRLTMSSSCCLFGSDRFALILIGVGALLPLVVEFIYLRDQFGTRMNTVFKFYFQAWVLWALASAYGAYMVARRLRNLFTGLWLAGVAVLVLAGLVYPVLAIPNKTDNFRGIPTLDGMAWLERVHSADYAAIRWLQANAPPNAVILEAPGNRYTSYDYAGRVSALTGLPTLLGWGGHQYQWRGNYDEPARREPDIEALFNGLDAQQTLTLLDKYRIIYVYVGPLERQRYQAAALAKFEQLMEVVYHHEEVTIYQR